ncbi:bifunctional 2-keto-4-hydroxyglutarate aldolase/2-keto-3-deoxy-6-phosphogluconate aldolase [Cohnella sp. CIP 111063]|jgi:Entner-Doudoroff aldolase|uniref:bifunctional 2-keto-4-hydroxyglutarate aldolase/2-keto-3-deoxy-6-phosphogluconate aldolase n=1 Tax=unclassified Cohnella TaxID=2636738 RepID=UPI000B8C0FCD|nr:MULTISPECIES: bifunctional 2-keto-4-hydroxyglutarate aldolase/2-keto-3-deoxy-6-phosphogluconate aldolase [unclassified Cohnella]OXS54476.1 bifunctional 2-keto-4-hydroxyglutarate aldolase/2-keto-3-deoxy-6-phosphogluconate aldolase [Cohnella sp. CIP 111063]PRX63978.1 2-dehydro-3-deoxyphosphogluconate aldolase/(4S)-4-hydroxy-2-oxoglutarate aldolase [Cohnella sp. SGD-V74]
MKKLQTIQSIVEQGVVAVLRGKDANEVAEMAEQAIAGGIKAIEITMTVPSALKAIEKLAAKYSSTASDPDKFAIIGVGTVLDPETARAAILSGSEFVVGPSLNPATVALCNRYRIPVMPGVMTIKEIQEALELGVDIVKLFPSTTPSAIKAIKGPLPQANIMPTGGVTLDNVGEWIAAGAVAVGIGSDLTNEAAKKGDPSLIAARAAQYVQAFKAARGR